MAAVLSKQLDVRENQSKETRGTPQAVACQLVLIPHLKGHNYVLPSISPPSLPAATLLPSELHLIVKG